MGASKSKTGTDTAPLTANELAGVDFKDLKEPKAGPVEKIPLPNPRDREKLAFVKKGVLSSEECLLLINATERRGYEKALINVGGGRQVLMTDVRNNDRCIADDPALADAIWQRIKADVPQVFRGCRAVGLNERLRFLRYDEEQKFDVHMDGEYRRENGERSYVTVQLYLNEGFEGGSTTFVAVDHDTAGTDVDCVPKTGMVLIFQHDIFHQGSALVKGRKYCLRTDVMYFPIPRIELEAKASAAKVVAKAPRAAAEAPTKGKA